MKTSQEEIGGELMGELLFGRATFCRNTAKLNTTGRKCVDTANCLANQNMFIPSYERLIIACESVSKSIAFKKFRIHEADRSRLSKANE